VDFLSVVAAALPLWPSRPPTTPTRRARNHAALISIDVSGRIGQILLDPRLCQGAHCAARMTNR
jgi:hypothetical protein